MTSVTENEAARHPPEAPRPKVVVTRKLLSATENRMAELFDVTLNKTDIELTRDQLAAAMRECDVLVPTVTDVINADVIEQAGPNLGMIANFGAGTDHIDINAAKSRNILITNTPGVFTEDTADLTMTLILAVSRRLGESVRTLYEGEWSGWKPSGLLGRAIGGRKLGIVGMGRIGQAVAHRARAFGMNITYHNRHQLPSAIENMLSARYEPNLDKLITEADILTLHCPSGAETHHLLDRRRLGLMKPDACIVNTGRGQLVEEEALIASLAQNRLGGAGLDVFANEPHLDPQLLALPNVIVLPHLGSATQEGREAAGERVIANIRFWVDGHRPPDQVLPDWN